MARIASIVIPPAIACVLLSILLVVISLIGGVIFGVYCIFTSFVSVQVNHYGLLYSTWTGQLDTNTVYEQGLKFVGPGHTVIQFDARAIPYRRRVLLRTSDGVNIDTELQFFLQLLKEQIPNIFLKYGIKYELAVSIIFDDALRNEASRFSSIDFAMARANVTSSLLSAARSRIDQEGITVTSMNILRLDMPERLEFFSESRSIIQQMVTEAQQEFNRQITATNTRINSDTNEARVRILRAQGTEEGRLSGEMRTLDGELARTEAQSEAYEKFAGSLGFTSRQLMTYLWIETFKSISTPSSSSTSTSFVNLDKPM